MGQARSCVSVDYEAIKANAGMVREAVGECLIMAVVKKNAYGHGLIKTSNALMEAGMDRLGIAETAEGVRLRESGVKCPIHILSPPLPHEMKACVDNDIIVTLSDAETARLAGSEAVKAGKVLKCHLIIDTGMGRFGPLPGDAPKIAVGIGEVEGIELEGAFTHFSHCDDTGKCSRQLNEFLEAVKEIRARGQAMPVLHAAACGTLYSMPEARLQMVRVGLCLFGVYNHCGMQDMLILRSAMTVTGRVTHVKTVPEGTPISYGGTCTTDRTTAIATIPIGYASGYDYRLSNCGWVAICGRRAPVLGRVTMDYIMVDVTDIPEVKAGTEAVIMGSPGPGAEELAQLASTVPHEVVCSFGCHFA